LVELENHPESGEGQPERLKHELAGLWSRRINQKDRLVYSINDDTVIVEVLSAMGHYNDR
jgi:toxin YoeB